MNGVFIAGDWGTSNLRLYLLQAVANSPARLLETRTGPGISRAQGRIETTFFELADAWLQAHGHLPVILSGMVGSTLGWAEVPYQTCPIEAHNLARNCHHLQARGLDIHIVAGLRARNPLGLVDVMRGEELQLLGWLAQHGTGGDTQLFALPGTHNKWVQVQNGQIKTFVTALTGELFALLQQHSVLLPHAGITDFSDSVFQQGLAASRQQPTASLLHTLFSTRSRQVTGELDATAATAWLSGLLIGADVRGALELFGSAHSERAINLIGEGRLCDLYTTALQHFGLRAERVDPTAVALAAYSAVYRELYPQGHQP